MRIFLQQQKSQKIDKIIKSVNPDRIYCQLFRMAEYVRNSKIKKTIDYQDAFSKGMERRSEKAVFPVKQLMKMEANRIARYEVEIFDDFDCKTMITGIDRDLIKHPMKHEIKIVPNGVDFSKFTEKDKKRKSLT